MRILAIDPGNEESAWCELVDGVPVRAAKEPNDEILARVYSNGWHDGTQVLAIEMIASYGMAVGREVFDTCVWVGRFLEAWGAMGGRHQLIYRKEVKLHLCETTRANDANIRASIIDRFGPGKEKAIGSKKNPGPLFGLRGDEWAALGVALTAAHKLVDVS